MPADKAPVEDVGGTVEEGPWPDGVTELVEGETYDRRIGLEDGSEQTVTVTVTNIQQVTRADGTQTDGYVVQYEYSGGGV